MLKRAMSGIGVGKMQVCSESLEINSPCNLLIYKQNN